MLGVFRKMTAERQAERKAELYRNLIRHEARIGGTLFGETPKNRRREFFCLDEKTWVWHEEWVENGQHKSQTTRYDVRPTGILKAQGDTYQAISQSEAQRLLAVARSYRDKVHAEMYTPVV